MDETEVRKPARGSPTRANERSRHRIVVACTRPELDSWHALAAKRGVKLSHLVRWLLDMEVAKEVRSEKNR